MFEVRNIAFAYRRPVLKDVSFVASRGETISILGDNGAGKTTLFRVLASLQVPDSGMVLSEGHDAFRDPIKYRGMLGYLPERIALYEDMTVKEYLSYRASLKGEPAKRIRRRIGEAANICQIADGQLRTVIRNLSQGQRKRVALADAILLRPRVLLLDDFLAGLDNAMRKSVGEILRMAAAFSSVIVAGHEIDDMMNWSTRFLVLRDGVISASIPAHGTDRAVLRARIDEALYGGAE